jgi:hypothetical protein
MERAALFTDFDLALPVFDGKVVDEEDFDLLLLLVVGFTTFIGIDSLLSLLL